MNGLSLRLVWGSFGSFPCITRAAVFNGITFNMLVVVVVMMVASGV